MATNIRKRYDFSLNARSSSCRDRQLLQPCSLFDHASDFSTKSPNRMRIGIDFRLVMSNSGAGHAPGSMEIMPAIPFGLMAAVWNG